MLLCRACARRAYSAVFAATLRPEGSSRHILRPIASQTTWRPPGRLGVVTAAQLLEPQDTEEGLPGRKAKPSSLEWAVKKQLKYMDDPFVIGRRVEKVLAEHNFDEAVLLTRQASKKASVVVSWNHLIEYEMKRGRLNHAIKLYNEVGLWPQDALLA